MPEREEVTFFYKPGGTSTLILRKAVKQFLPDGSYNILQPPLCLKLEQNRFVLKPDHPEYDEMLKLLSKHPRMGRVGVKTEPIEEIKVERNPSKDHKGEPTLVAKKGGKLLKSVLSDNIGKGE